MSGTMLELETTRSWPGLGNALIRAREALLNWLVGARPSLVINDEALEVETAVPTNLAARLRQTLVQLKASAMDETGERVDYAVLRRSEAYAAYRREELAALRHFRPADLPDAQARRTFWINLYNALVLDAVITFGVQRSVTEGRLGLIAFFRRAAYLVDGQRVSLEDIEHGILRTNRGNPYLPGAHFPAGDPRLAWVVPLDPRLHFALNCGGRSCPPIRAYSAAQLDTQLDLASKSFVAGTVEVRPEAQELWLSSIFRWYQRDFGGEAGVRDFLRRHLPDDDRRRCLAEMGDGLRLRYKAYDWGLNGV